MDAVDQGYDAGWLGDVGQEFEDPQIDEQYQRGFAAARKDRSAGHPYGTSKAEAEFPPLVLRPDSLPPYYDGPTMEATPPGTPKAPPPGSEEEGDMPHGEYGGEPGKVWDPVRREWVWPWEVIEDVDPEAE